MKNILIVVDMQKDFITGSLGTKEAEAIVPNVISKIKEYETRNDSIVFTKDTHTLDYLKTQEGTNLPVMHCIKGEDGWSLCDSITLYEHNRIVFEKPTFASVQLAEYLKEHNYTTIELVGLCTDICVISNAMLIKAFLPEATILVDASCCAGVTPQSHFGALEAMKMCQINVS